MKIAIFLVTGLILSGCANFNSVHRALNVDDGTGAIIDIKQRAIFSSQRGEGKDRQTIICAEPSPDSLSAYAAELAGDAGIGGKKKAGIKSILQEETSFVGLRTQSIQLLRDSLYRLCEGYMSGALEKEQYDILMRRYQRYMVALLAIEQLTKVSDSPAVKVNLKNWLAHTDAVIAELKKEKKGLKNDEDKDKRIEEIDGKIKILEEKKKTVKYEVAKNMGDPRGNYIPEKNMETIAKTVERIVTNILDVDDMGQLCWTYLSKGNRAKEEGLERECLAYMRNINEKNEMMNKVIKAAMEREAANNPEEFMGAIEQSAGTAPH
uniref:Lipoprotein n=1 Tax=Candidatus Kentrum sp. TUN TaxID=2126343 RepID=A0A450ZJE6_9GAMM|nr:MAG: hypothetical protein BECKTUN1418F_GA0071002_103123 [Candidatus Kentron sp. TUN]VFK55751.1 MAG: hypothetical protein BECKTUN1418E_GA0071001_103224 [Candidatus Kentron sp. TUN]